MDGVVDTLERSSSARSVRIFHELETFAAQQKTWGKWVFVGK